MDLQGENDNTTIHKLSFYPWPAEVTLIVQNIEN